MESDPRKKAYRAGLQREYQFLIDALDNVNTGRVFDDRAVTTEEIAKLERAVMSMRTQLRPLIQTGELVQLWDSYELDKIPDECAIEIKETVQYADYGAEKEVQRTKHASLGRLEFFAEGLMRVFTTLGFAPEIEHSEKQTKIDADLLKEVDQWRRANVQ